MDMSNSPEDNLIFFLASQTSDENGQFAVYLCILTFDFWLIGSAGQNPTRSP